MKKSVIIILSTLIVINIALGALGLMTSLKGEKPSTEPKEYEIKYKYYLDDVEVSAMPINNRPTTETPEGDTVPDENTNTSEYVDEYSFKNYTCTNNVVGSWDNEAWEFTPEKTSDATCVLYFESNFFTVNLTANNGEVNILEDFKDRKIQRGETVTFNVTPKEGYKYEKIECKNNETAIEVDAEWKDEDKKVTIKGIKQSDGTMSTGITKDLTCEISFIISEYKVTFEVQNGIIDGEKEQTTEYGKEVATKVTPAKDHIFDKVTCTNNQSATYNEATNTLTIAKLTKETKCTINFKPNDFDVTIKTINGTVDDGTGNKKTTITSTISNSGEKAFQIEASDGYSSTNPEISCTNGQKGSMLGEGVFKISNVTNDTTCTITFKEKQEGTTQSE